jgi:DNA-binding PadR family transcriptional regulator
MPSNNGSVLELAILGLLTEQDLHGYELRRRLGELLGPIGRLSFGTLYPALNRLEAGGALTVVKVTESRTGLTTERGRKVYGITKQGQELFGELLETSSNSSDDDRSFALRLAFARYLSSEARLRLLIRRREQLAERLAETQGTIRARQGRLDDYGSSLMEHRIDMTRSDIAWLDQLIATEYATGGAVAPKEPSRKKKTAAPRKDESSAPETTRSK